jgi:hypothetical protein
MFFHSNLVTEEFFHYIGVNYLYAPWLLLLQSSLISVSKIVPYFVLCCTYAIPVVMLDMKIYGQWFTTEEVSIHACKSDLPDISNRELGGCKDSITDEVVRKCYLHFFP